MYKKTSIILSIKHIIINLICITQTPMSEYSKVSDILMQKQSPQDESTQSFESIGQEIMMSIESIQKFYNINSKKTLINIIIDQKQSIKLRNVNIAVWSVNNNTADVYFSTEKQQKRINYFAEKYSYQGLVEKFPKPKSGTNQLLLKILEKKFQSNVITSHQTRKKIWLLASGAKFSMINNKNLYQNLLKYHDYPKYFQRSIVQDLHRTVSKNTSLQVQQDMAKLKNVLIAFSRRNPYIGYCQGLNFIAFFLLTMQFTEEQAFFLLSTMLESIIPMDYYTNMIGVVCDQQIFINILKVMKPHIIEKFDQLGLDPSILSIQWFVCLFTSSLPFYLVKIVWDRLLVEGTRAFMKTGLILLSYFEDSIMQASQFHEIIMILEKGSKNLQVSQIDFNAQFQKYYIDKHGLNIARNLYREYHIKDKLEQKVISKRAKISQPKCNKKWPICISKLQKLKRQREEIDVWIYRAENSPKLIPDYLTNKSQNFQQKMNITGTFIANNQSNYENVQDSIKIDSINTSLNTQSIGISPKKLLQTKYLEQNNGFSKNKQLSTIQTLQKTNSTIAKNSKDLIIGRMQHICHRHAIEMQRIKKVKKSEIKFLSMIFSGEEGQQVQQKRLQTYQKIAKASQILSQGINVAQDEGIGHLLPYPHNNQSPTIPLSPQNQDKKILQKKQRSSLAQSQTIIFYNQFMQKNKQLSQIISIGVQNLKRQSIGKVEIVKEDEGIEEQNDNDEKGGEQELEGKYVKLESFVE